VCRSKNLHPNTTNSAGGQQEHETRCHLEFSDRQLTVTYVKKDEGFESDTESAKSVEPAAAHAHCSGTEDDEDKTVSAVEEKIIKDHVFRYSESGNQVFHYSESGNHMFCYSESGNHVFRYSESGNHMFCYSESGNHMFRYSESGNHLFCYL
jgi:hypothetical protein